MFKMTFSGALLLHLYGWVSEHFTTLLYLTSTSVMQKVFFNTSKVKVKVEGQMFKLNLFSLKVLMSSEKSVSICQRSSSQLKVK